jgi:hypothetical protein
MPRPDSSATDVADLITDLDGGAFELMLSRALSEAAAAAVDHERKAEVTIKFKIERIKNTHQVRVEHELKYNKPTSVGRSSEEVSTATVLHVGKFGALTLAQPSLLEKEQLSFKN